MTIHSEAFKNAYAIFVNKKALPIYKQIVKRNNLEEVDFYEATFEEDLAMIIMPLSDKTKDIETLLFKQSQHRETTAFWGQVGVGYKGKRWIKV